MAGLVFLWMFRNPNFLRGWAELFCPEDQFNIIKDLDLETTTVMSAINATTIDYDYSSNETSILEKDITGIKRVIQLNERSWCYAVKPKVRMLQKFLSKNIELGVCSSLVFYNALSNYES